MAITSLSAGSSSSVHVLASTALVALGLTAGIDSGEFVTFELKVYFNGVLVYTLRPAATDDLERFVLRTINVAALTGSKILLLTVEAVNP